MFENIAGHDNIKNILSNNINTKNILHSYLFIGEDGIGKKMLAKEFAKAILCTSENNRPCNICKSCVEFNTNNNANFNLINEEGSAIKIEQIRNMQVKIAEKPINSNYKVYLINDAELMTQEAQNCLLKTLEEPPEYIVIILITSNENKVLNTIKSRCMKLYFNNLDKNSVKKVLTEKFEMEDINDSFLDAAGGSIKKALLIKEKSSEYEQITKLFDIIDKENLVNFINSASIIYENKDDIYNILDYINILLDIKIRSNSNNSFKFSNCIFTVEEVKKRLRANSNYDMSIDYLLMNMWKEINGERSSRY